MVEYAAYQVKWTEYERGYGQRPCGSSLYPTREAAEAAIEAHWAGYPDGPAPDTYIAPSEPKVIAITEEQYKEMVKDENEGSRDTGSIHVTLIED